MSSEFVTAEKFVSIVYSPGGECVGSVTEVDLYGTPIWKAVTPTGDYTNFTTYNEAISWLLYGTT